MLQAIDPIGLDGTMHDKETVHPLQIPRTQEASHAKDIKKGEGKKLKGKKLLRPMTISMHTNELNHDVVGVKRRRLKGKKLLKTECCTEACWGG